MDKTSIVIATYNGSQYIIEQLESIRTQTKHPDEVIICDDNSTDTTVEMVTEYITKNKLDNWSIIKNKHNIGWQKNFLQGMKKAKGDIIFYCDQDDVWESSKIEEIVRIYNQKKSIKCLAHTYSSIDANGWKMDYTVDKKGKNTKKVKKVEVGDNRFWDNPSGCTMAIKRDLLKYVRVSGKNALIDRQFCRYATFLGGMYIYDYALIKHRFHINNTSLNIDKASCVLGSATQLDRNDTLFNDLKDLINFRTLCLDEKVKKKTDLVINLMLARWKYIHDYNCIIAVLFNSMTLYTLKPIIGDLCYKYNINSIVGHMYKMLRIR